jgi:hypothetical protein
MQTAIGYLRVSTQEQGRSGLGLAAQQFEIETFGKREGFTVNSWHQDVQTGAGTDALLLRPGLAAGPEKKKKKLLDPKTWERDGRLVEVATKLRGALGETLFEDHNVFRDRVDRALEKAGTKLAAADLKQILKAASWRVETAPPVLAKVHKPGKAKADWLANCTRPINKQPIAVLSNLGLKYDPVDLLRTWLAKYGPVN